MHTDSNTNTPPLVRMALHILHISDLHARPERQADMEIVLSALFRKLDQICAALDWKIDCVCFTGDLAYSGLSEQYAHAATMLLDPLQRRLAIPRHSFFLVPGNHDVRRVTEGEGLRHELHLADTLVDRVAVNKLLDSESDRNKAFSRLQSFRNFILDYFGALIDKDPTYSLVRFHEADGVRIGIACLNSAWRCNSDHDAQRILLGERQVDIAAGQMADTTVRVSLLHHPFRWLCEFDERDCYRRLLQNSDLILSGHVHDPLPVIHDTPFGRCLFSSAGAVFDGRTYNGFSIIELDANSLSGEVLMFRYYDDRRAFDTDVLVTQTGRFPFSLSKPSSGTSPPPLARRTVMHDTEIRETVVAVFNQLHGHRGGWWLLGIALGLTSRVPRPIGDQTAAAVEFDELTAHAADLAAFFQAAHGVGRDLKSGRDTADSAIRRLRELAARSTALWPSPAEQAMIDEFDHVVKALIDPGSVAAEVAVTKLAEVDLHLSEQQFDRALMALRSLDPTDPDVASRLAYALYETRHYGEVVALLLDRPIATLPQEDMQHCIWSLCELKRFSQAREWLRHHTRFQTTSSRVFRRLVPQRFPELTDDSKQE